MSEQNRTAPRWEDVPEDARELATVHLVRVRERFQKSAAQWAKRGHSRNVSLAMHAVNAIDAALARLAEPAQSSAAERWRAVPAEERADLADALGDVLVPPRLLLALDALLALAREAEGGGA